MCFLTKAHSVDHNRALHYISCQPPRIQSTIATIGYMGVASAKDQAENQFLGKRYICVTLLLGFPFSGKPNYEFPFIYKRGNPTSRLGLTPNDII